MRPTSAPASSLGLPAPSTASPGCHRVARAHRAAADALRRPDEGRARTAPAPGRHRQGPVRSPWPPRRLAGACPRGAAGRDALAAEGSRGGGTLGEPTARPRPMPQRQTVNLGWSSSVPRATLQLQNQTAAEFTVPHTPRSRDTGPRPRPLGGLLIGRGAVTVFAAALAAACGKADSKVGADSAAGDPPSTTAYAHAQDCAAALGRPARSDVRRRDPGGAGACVEGGGLRLRPAGAFQSPCERGILARVQGTRPDGTEDPDVRISIFRSGGFAAIMPRHGRRLLPRIDDLPSPS